MIPNNDCNDFVRNDNKRTQEEPQKNTRRTTEEHQKDNRRTTEGYQKTTDGPQRDLIGIPKVHQMNTRKAP